MLRLFAGFLKHKAMNVSLHYRKEGRQAGRKERKREGADIKCKYKNEIVKILQGIMFLNGKILLL